METTTTPRAGTPPVEPRHRMMIAMEWAQVSRSEMADILGCSGNTVSNYTKGHTKPSDAVMRVWAMRCGVPFEWITDGVANGGDPDGGGITMRETAGERVTTLHPSDFLALVA